MRCVSIGECMVEVAPGDAPGTCVTGFAGDTFNMAWYLARLNPDWRVDYLSAVGVDAVSDRFLAFAAGAGIGTGHVARIPDRTLGLYLIDVAEGERTFTYWRGQSAARLLAEDPDRLARGLSGADLVLFSGVTLAILAPGDRDRLLGAVTAARAGGARVAFDPNLRPALWPGPEAMRAGIMAGAAAADLVLPSLDEECAHFGDASAEETCLRYLRAGAATVVVKNGAGTIRFATRTAAGETALPAIVRPRDTTAAGDSFDAACIASLARGATLSDAVLAGARLAARVVQGRGALVPV